MPSGVGSAGPHRRVAPSAGAADPRSHHGRRLWGTTVGTEWRPRRSVISRQSILHQPLGQTGPHPRLVVQWEVQLARLADYKVAHGNCNVPWGWADDPKLASWIDHQWLKCQCWRELARPLPAQRLVGYSWCGKHRLHSTPWNPRWCGRHACFGPLGLSTCIVHSLLCLRAQ
jgi:hypothetical protein